jgi:hypothetical protein
MKAGRGGGGENAKELRVQLPELGRQFQGDRHFADANSMDPGAAVRAETRPHFAIIKTEALPELVPVISAPEQLGNLARKKEEQPNRVEKIIEEPDHSMRARFDRNAAPLQKEDLGGSVLSCANSFPQRRGRHFFRGTLFQHEDAGRLEHFRESIIFEQHLGKPAA